MIEEESNVDPKAVAHTDHFDEALLYDLSKFLTTLALLALGGVLTLSQTAGEHAIRKPAIAFVGGSIAIAGICAVSAALRLARVGTSKRRPRLTPQQYLMGAVAFLGLGAGGFLTMWWNSL